MSLVTDGVLSLLSSVSLVVQWVDVTRLEKNATLLFPESIRVDTRDQELFFSMFLNIGETFKLMEQLANLAMRQLLDSEGFLEDKALPRPIRPHKNISALKRYVALLRSGESHSSENRPLGLGPLTLPGVQHMPSWAHYLTRKPTENHGSVVYWESHKCHHGEEVFLVWGVVSLSPGLRPGCWVTEVPQPRNGELECKPS